MKIEHNYSGTRKYAYEQVDVLLERLQKENADKISDPVRSWNAAKDRMKFSFRVYGFTLKGTVQIEEERVVLEGKVPFLARMFQGKAEKIIRAKLEEIL